MSENITALIENHQNFLESKHEQLQQVALDPDMVEKIRNVAVLEMHKNPNLATASLKSMFFAVQKACELGLVAGGGLSKAHLVVYNQKNHDGNYEPTASLQIGYEGLIDLMLRSGQVKSIVTEVVYEGDEFKRWTSAKDGPMLEHVPADDDDRGKMSGVYAILFMANDTVKIEYMSRAQVEKVKSKSKSAKSGPWVEFPEQMWRKTVIKRASKYIRLTADVASAIASDTMFDIGVHGATDNEVSTSRGSRALRKLMEKRENVVDVDIVSGTEPDQEEEAEANQEGEAK